MNLNTHTVIANDDETAYYITIRHNRIVLDSNGSIVYFDSYEDARAAADKLEPLRELRGSFRACPTKRHRGRGN